MSVNTVVLPAGQTRLNDQDPPNQQTTLTMTLTHAWNQTNYHSLLMVVWTMLTITHLLSEEYIYIKHNDDVCKPQKRLMYNIELTSSIIHIFVKSVMIMIINQTALISTLKTPNREQSYHLSNINLNANIYLYNITDRKVLTKLTDKIQASKLSETTTSKKVSAFPFFAVNTCSSTKIFTYLDRAKFSPPFECVNPANNPIMSVKSIEIQCENTQKCIHVLHLGFVLVTSVTARSSPRSPKQLLFNTRLYGLFIKVVIVKEPVSPMFSYWDNKYNQKLARLENKLQVTCQNWTKMHVFINLNGKNTPIRTWTHYTIHGRPSLSGINCKNYNKKPKYQPINYTRLAKIIIIMIIEHHFRIYMCITHCTNYG